VQKNLNTSTKTPGLFITFEGTEGAGKSTLIQKIAYKLRRQGHTVMVTREPGGTTLSEKIRSLILTKKMNPWTEVFLYQAARVEHLQKKVIPALKKNKIVLCDRFTDSTLAYQSYARGLSWNKVKDLNKLATQNITPQMTVLLDLPPEVGLKRVKEFTRFEAEGVAFQKKVRKGFIKSRREMPNRWLTIDTHLRTPQELTVEVVSAIEKRFSSRLRKKKKTRG